MAENQAQFSEDIESVKTEAEQAKTEQRSPEDVLGAAPGEEKLTTSAPTEIASKPDSQLESLNQRARNRYSASRDVDAQNLRDRAFSESDIELELAKKSKAEKEQKLIDDQKQSIQSSEEEKKLDSEILKLQEQISFIESEGGTTAATQEKLNALLLKKEGYAKPLSDDLQADVEKAPKASEEESAVANNILDLNADNLNTEIQIDQAKKEEAVVNHNRNKERTSWQEELDSQRAALEKAKERLNSDDLKIKAESKETFWGSLSVPEKIIAGISLFLGAAGSGGRNFAAADFNAKVKEFSKAKGKSNEQALLQRKHAYERVNLELDIMSKMINNKDKLDKLQMLKDNNIAEARKAQKEREALLVRNYMKEKLLKEEIKLENLTPEQINAVMDPDDFKTAKGIRAEYQKETEKLGTREVINSYRDVVSMAKDGATGKTDIALLTKFMKTLDPGSVVREGEFKIAEDASPALRAVVTKMKGLVTGEKLAPTDRKEFAKAVSKLLKPKLRTQAEVNNRFKSVIRQHGLPSSLVIEDFSLEKISKRNAIIEMQKKRFPNKSQAQIEKAVDKLFPNID